MSLVLGPSLAAILCLASALCAQTVPDADQAWKHFFAWWSQQPVVTRNSLNQYRTPYVEHLKREGLSAAQADTRMKFIESEAFRRPDFSQALYDSRYTTSDTVFNQEPNAFVARIAAGLRPGLALDVQMGQGRNAVHLARTGWSVTGFDISGEGVRVAREAASRGEFKLEAVQADHRAFEYGVAKWDLIVLSYPWIPFSDRAVYEKIIKSLKPGGSIVYEHFLRQTGGAAGHVPIPNQLFSEFGALHILF